MNPVAAINPLQRYPYSPITRGVSLAALRGLNSLPSASVVATTPLLNATAEINLASGHETPFRYLEQELNPALVFNAFA